MKRNIFCIALGAVIATIVTVGVYAINASEITYNDTTLDVTLDDLYTTASKYENITFFMTVDSNSNQEINSTFFFPTGKYSHFKVLRTVNDANINTCTIKAWDKNNATLFNIDLNTEYDILSSGNVSLSGLLLFKTNAVEGTWGRCSAEIQLYN